MTKDRIAAIKELLHESDFICDPDACREVILELIKDLEQMISFRDDPNPSLLES